MEVVHATGGESQLAPLFGYVDAHRQQFLDGLMPLLRQPSISSHGTGIADCARLLSDEMRQVGLAARVVATDGHPVVYGEHRRPGTTPTLLLYGHDDVQPVEPLDAWHSPPFEPTIRNGRIYARGSADNKGQHFAHLKAIEAIASVVGDLPVHVKILLDGEEERGSPNLARFVCEHRDQLAADVVYTSDGPYHASCRPVINSGEPRGRVALQGHPDHHRGAV